MHAFLKIQQTPLLSSLEGPLNGVPIFKRNKQTEEIENCQLKLKSPEPLLSWVRVMLLKVTDNCDVLVLEMGLGSQEHDHII